MTTATYCPDCDVSNLEVGMTVYGAGILEAERTVVDFDCESVIVYAKNNPLTGTEVFSAVPTDIFFMLYSEEALWDDAGNCLCENCLIQSIIDDGMATPLNIPTDQLIAAVVMRTLELVDAGLL